MIEQIKYLPKTCYSDRILQPEAIVKHFISAKYVDPHNPYSPRLCWNILRDYKLSYHHIICRDESDGVIHCVPRMPLKVAWHAGKSEYKGRTGWNSFSVGICLIGDEESGFTDFQYDADAWFTQYYMARFGIARDMVVGHETIAGFRGKVDPGIATGNYDLERTLPDNSWG